MRCEYCFYDITDPCATVVDSAVCVNLHSRRGGQFGCKREDCPLAFKPGSRSSIYGTLEENGRVSQGIKNLLRSGQSWDKMTPGQQETLDQCALKMSRIVTGTDPNYRDHWEDLKGYPEAILKEMPE